MDNQHLGKGLESLIPKKTTPPVHPENITGTSDETAIKKEAIFYIETEKIVPNPEQPRTEFDPDRLKELARSIKEHGILQPLVVTKLENEKLDGGIEVTYQLIAGERRLRASKMVGLPRVPVIIRKAGTREKEKLELAIIENVQRENLNIIERAHAYNRLMQEFNLSQEDVSVRMAKSRESIANALRLLNLPPEIQQALAEGRITEGHARTILSIKSPENQLYLFKEILAKQASVRESEEMAKAIKASIRKDLGMPALNPEEKALQERLEQSLGTRVALKKKGDKGKIVIEFFSEEELSGLLDKITGKKSSDSI